MARSRVLHGNNYAIYRNLIKFTILYTKHTTRISRLKYMTDKLSNQDYEKIYNYIRIKFKRGFMASPSYLSIVDMEMRIGNYKELPIGIIFYTIHFTFYISQVYQHIF